MREIQVRRAYFGDDLFVWPLRCCDSGPDQSPGDYPPDGFYGYEDLDDLEKYRIVGFVSLKMAEMVDDAHFLTPAGIKLDGALVDVTSLAKNRYRSGMLAGVGVTVTRRNVDAVLEMMSESMEKLIYTPLDPSLNLDGTGLGIVGSVGIAEGEGTTWHVIGSDPQVPYADVEEAYDEMFGLLEDAWIETDINGDGFGGGWEYGPSMYESVTYGPDPLMVYNAGWNGGSFTSRNGAWDAWVGPYTNAQTHLYLIATSSTRGVNPLYPPTPPLVVTGDWNDPENKPGYFVLFDSVHQNNGASGATVDYDECGYTPSGPWVAKHSPYGATGSDPCWNAPPPPPPTIPCEIGWRVEEWAGYIQHAFQPPTSTPSGTCTPCEHSILIFTVPQPSPDTPGSGGISGPGSSGDDDPADDVEDCETDGEATDGETDKAIVLASGHKLERATDLVVALPGMDFRLVREYTSQYDFYGAASTGGLVGENWTMSAFQRLYGDVESTGTKYLYTGTNGRDRTYTETSSGSGVWSPGGPTSQTLVAATLDVDGTDYRVWRLISQGSWEIDYYRETDDVSGFADVDADLAGHILQVRDAWGNPHHYEYKLHDAPSSGSTYRLDRIILHSTPALTSQAAAFVNFSWHFREDDEEYDAANGRLAGVFVTRPGGGITQAVDYYYYDEQGLTVVDPPCASGSSGGSSFLSTCTYEGLGTDGDLIQVVKRVRTDSAIQMRADAGMDPDDPGAPWRPWRTLVWQYRYHIDGVDQWTATGGPTTSTGYDHQLRMIIQPEQVEELYRQLVAAEVTVGDIEVAASQLLYVPDEALVPTTGSFTLSVRPIDLAMKLIGYESSGNYRVKNQWLSAGCGCSGSTNGKRLDYTYINGWSGGKSVHIAEHMYVGSAYTPYRTLFYDMETRSGTEYLRVKAVKDTRTGTLGPGESAGRTWVWEFTRSGGSDTLVQIATPSATDGAGYVPASAPSTAPTWPSGMTDGLVYGYVFDANNRIIERRISEGVKSTIGDMELLSATTYSTGARTDLPTLVKRFRSTTTTTSVSADDVEETAFSYEFHDVNDKYLAYVVVTAERELVDENGPGSPDDEVESVELFSSTGLNEWSLAADTTLTRREFDPDTGRVTKLTRNADVADFVAADYGSPTTTGWGEGGQRLVWEYARDVLGRRVQMTGPGGTKSYVRRTMLPGDIGLDSTTLEGLSPTVNPVVGIELYVEVTLPQDLESAATAPKWERDLRSSTYAGPAMIRWFNAAGKVVRTGEFQIGLSNDQWAAYAPEIDSYSVRIVDGSSNSADLARSIHEINVIGQRTESHVWHRIETPDASSHFYTTQFEYDEVGRVESVTDPTGTMTSTPAFDIWDRPLSRAVGTSSGSQVVEEVFYDSSTAATQGVGNGTVTSVRRYLGDSTSRDLIRSYDYRDRPTVVEAELPPHQLLVYDNLDRVTERGLFTAVPTVMTTTNRVSHELMHYSQRGLLYRSQKAIDPTSGSPTYLESQEWFDEVGRSIASWGPNSPTTKVVYDALSRPTTVYVTDRGGDAAPGTSGSWDDAAALTSDQVIEQVEYAYNDFGSAASVTSRQRLHDAGTSTGALAGSTSVSSYVFMQYDDAGRQIATVDLGTSSDLFESTTSAPATPGLAFDSEGEPVAIADALVSRVYYDRRGLLGQTVSPDLTYTQFAYDAMRRRIATIENYTEVQPNEIVWDTDRWSVSVIGAGGLSAGTPDLDRVTSFVYDGASQLVRRVAHFVDGSGFEDAQETKYEYGVTKPGGSPGATDSLVNSNRLLKKVHYPHETTGAPGTTTGYQVTYAYNALGELRAYIDQNGTTHLYARDDLGRVTADSVPTAGSGIDTSVGRIAVGYDTAGRVDTISSHDHPTADSIVNEVQFTYTPLWQIDKVKQSFDGSIATGTVRTVDYNYSNQGVSGLNYSRLSTTLYPSATNLNTGYGSGGSVSSRISRPKFMTYIQKNPGPFVQNKLLVEYDYVGMGRVAITDYTGIDIQLDRTVTQDGDRTSGVYPGWDRWGRVRLHQWVDGGFGPHGTEPDYPDRPQIFAEAYGYDADSNRTSKHDVRNGVSYVGNSWSFEYDGLDRLNLAVKGDWDFSTLDPVAGGQAWDLDVLGNWDNFLVDADGDGVFDEMTEVAEDREHNFANEITDSDATTPVPFTYDDAGNTTEYPAGTGAKYQLVYDAWNRLVQVKLNDGTTDTEILEQEFNGLHWRTVVRRDTDLPVDGIDQMRVLTYDASWRLVEEMVDDNWSSGFTADRTLEQFWGLRYIDDPILRRPDPEAVGGYWHVTDVQFSTMALLDNNAAVYERVWYTPYGEARHHWGQDYDGDRDYDFDDTLTLLNVIGSGDVPIDDPDYVVEMDRNRDGVLDADDIPSGTVQTAVALGQISDLDATSGPDNWFGYAGYVWDGASGQYHVRHRNYVPSLGRWLQRDPAGYVDGMGLYEYVRSWPAVGLDPTGLKLKVRRASRRSTEEALQKLCPGTEVRANGTVIIPEQSTDDESGNDEEENCKSDCDNPPGCDLLRSLQAHPQDIFIDKSGKDSSAEFKWRENDPNGIVWIRILWNDKTRLDKPLSVRDENGDLKESRHYSAWEALWHELIHADHSINGDHYITYGRNQDDVSAKEIAREEIKTIDEMNKLRDWFKDCVPESGGHWPPTRDPFGHPLVTPVWPDIQKEFPDVRRGE